MSTVHEGIAGSRTPAPKLGRSDREEIGRALASLYDDVVRQGVPTRVAHLLDGLAARVDGDRS
jgi:hypothetical protein